MRLKVVVGMNKEHDNFLIGIDKVGWISTVFDLNISSIDTKELNVLIQSKWRYCCFKIYYIIGLCCTVSQIKNKLM
jgi:hypothetical protein